MAKARKANKTIDFLGARPKAPVDNVRQLREAENVLSSYSRARDLLAEALQNALDAVDSRSEVEEGAPREVKIKFDPGSRRFTVFDSGTGISAENLEIILTPNVTLKSGKLASPLRGRSRGEKGVGLSFLALASDYLHIRTSDGTDRHDVIVEKANTWVQSEGETEKPVANLSRSDPDQLHGSECYTEVTVGAVDPHAFDRDLFSYGKGELVWTLRTATAVGNTAPLFKDLDRPQPDSIDIALLYLESRAVEAEWVEIPYQFATPEDLVPGLKILDAEELKGLSREAMATRTKGKGVRYVERFETRGGYDVDVYIFIIHGRDMGRLLEEARASGSYIPSEWQGLEVATRDMPTGVGLSGGVIQPRSLERRVFGLFQYDDLKLDLGRKTLAGQTSRMFNEVLQSAWEEDLRSIIFAVGPAERKVSNVGLAALKAAVKDGLERPDLDSDLPYLKLPMESLGVMALFHEIVARRAIGGAELRTLRTEVFGKSDALIYVGQPNGVPPQHVLFAADSHELINALESDEQRTETVSLAVLWELNETFLDEQGISHVPVDGSEAGATHELELAGIGGKEKLDLMVLSEALASDEK